MAFGEETVYYWGESFGFRTEDEKVSWLKCRGGKAVFAVCREGEHA